MDYTELRSAVIEGNPDKAISLTRRALDQGVAPERLITEGLLPGLAVVGERFKKGEMFVPEVLMSARVMNSCLQIVRPLVVGTELPTKGRVALGTVKGDLHDIGKNLVGMLLEASGFQVIDLGIDVDEIKFIKAVRESSAEILGMSALLTTTMLHMKDVVDTLKEEGLRERVKVMVGGAPVTRQFAEEIGADGYAPDAASAVDLARQLVGDTA
ncbi:MAG: corrinoid protein [Bacillota bacterium]